MYDTAIIGTGAAGISAALTLKARNKNVAVFGTDKLSGKIRSAEKIRNYPGLPMVSGEEMSRVFRAQLDEMGVEIISRTVTGIYAMGGFYSLLCDQDAYEAKTIILCTGVATVKPVPGELEFLGRGVSYCATCDGFLYKGKTLAVECTSKELEPEVSYLAELAEKIYLFPLYKDPHIAESNVELIVKRPREIKGGRKADTVVYDGGEVKVDGVFMLTESVSPGVLLYGIETDGGHIKVDRECRTNLEGVFAAGDCTGRPYQYAKAVGEGNVAAHSALDYLAAKR